jgi:enolase
MGSEIFHTLKAILKERGFSTGVGDEGGFAPALSSTTVALDLLMLAIERAGYRPGEEVALALDVAASEFAEEGGRYRLTGEGVTRTSEEMATALEGLVGRYPIVSIEDGLGEDDWSGWALLTRRLGAKSQLMGDDAFVITRRPSSRGSTAGSPTPCSCAQPGGHAHRDPAGHRAGQAQGYGTVISHRSGRRRTPSW